MRKLLATAIVLTGLAVASAARTEESAAEILVQVSMTAGLRYHEAKAVWEEMHVGDPLTLVREPENPYDARAVRVEWHGHKLGYIPRTENAAVARQLDRGNALQARLTKLVYYRNHRRKLELEVFLPL
jgi:HIRAN domain